MVFPIGAPNDAFAKYFIGQSYLAPLSTEQIGIFNVTFEPGCRNNWHIHHAAQGGGQILVCVAGRGYYQEDGKPARKLYPGDVVNIPAGVKIGTALRRTAGFPTWRWRCRVKTPPTSGWSRYRTRSTASCAEHNLQKKTSAELTLCGRFA